MRPWSRSGADLTVTGVRREVLGYKLGAQMYGAYEDIYLEG